MQPASFLTTKQRVFRLVFQWTFCGIVVKNSCALRAFSFPIIITQKNNHETQAEVTEASL